MQSETQGVFIPKEGNYFQNYPELKSIPEFEQLTEPEMKYVFYMYNHSSPFVKCNRADRHMKSLDMSFNNGNTDKRFPIANIPDYIEQAGDVMSKVNIGVRTQADNMVRQMFSNFSKITNVDEVTLAAMDLDDKKRYVEMVVKATEALPVMISSMEQGFGTRALISRPKEEKVKKVEEPKEEKSKEEKPEVPKDLRTAYEKKRDALLEAKTSLADLAMENEANAKKK